MTHRLPFRRLRVSCLAVVLAWPVVQPAYSEQHASPDVQKQVYEKILEARGRARAKRFPEALGQLGDAVSLAEGMDDKLPLALALHNTAEIRLLEGEPQDALKAYHRALGVYTELGHEAGVGMVRKRIRTLSRLLSKPREPTAPVAETVPPAEAREPLSFVDQAVERIRQRQRARDQVAPETAPPGPVRVTRSEPRDADEPGEQAYVESLRNKISGNSRYPDYAKRTGQEGAVDVAFAVQENGDVEKVEVLKSSGSIVLDVEALRNVRESAPFEPVPDSAASGPLTVRLTFSYKLPAETNATP